MNDETMLEVGRRTRQEVLGAEHVDRSLAQASEFARPMQELVTEYCWGAVWSRPGLDRKVRSLLNIAMLTALGRRHELEIHVRGAINNGVDAAEIQEALLQTAVYCGVPAAMDAMRAAEAVLRELGVAEPRVAEQSPRERRPNPRRVGFVGLGAMGGPMARRLVQAGHDVSVYDTAAEAVHELAEAGAAACESPRAVADVAELVLVSLPSPEIVAAVAEQLAQGAAMRVYVDLSTTGPEVAEAVARRLAAGGVGSVDAPVSGGTAGAESGRLTIMAAGAGEDVAAVRPLLEVLGATIFVVGDRPGQGQAVKVINNLMSACSIAITAEATALGVKAGLDPATLLEVVAASSGSNTAAADKFPRYVLSRTFHQGFRLNLMAKDVRLCLAEARRRNVPMLLGGTVEQLWNLGEASFAQDADFIEIVRMFERWADATITS